MADKKSEIPKSGESLDTAENIASKTTVEQDLRTAGQRGLNLIWENTQRNLAYGITTVALLADFLTVAIGLYALVVGLTPSPLIVVIWTGALMQLNTMAGIVIGFYFGRTNHARIGDDPKKDKEALDNR